MTTSARIGIVLAGFLLVGCAARPPRGVEVVGAGTAYPPTSGVAYGFSPLSYDAPGGRTLRIHGLAESAAVTSQSGVFASSTSTGSPSVGTQTGLSVTNAPYTSFRVTYGAVSLECNEASLHSSGWFTCRSASGRVSFAMGSGEACASDLVGEHAWNTLSNPACWLGKARVGDASFKLSRGDSLLEIVWDDASAKPVLAASLGAVPTVFATQHSVASDVDDALVALSFAVHFHQDARASARSR